MKFDWVFLFQFNNHQAMLLVGRYSRLLLQLISYIDAVPILPNPIMIQQTMRTYQFQPLATLALVT